MDNFETLIGREHIDPRLLINADPSLARVMGQLNLCTCFAGVLNGENIAACLLDESGGDTCDAVNFAVGENHKDDGVDMKILNFVTEYAQQKGFRYMEIGAGNAQLDLHRMLQRRGFRVIGVEPDHYQGDGKSMVVENGIVNRDMIRYRADFNDGWTTWTEEVK